MKNDRYLDFSQNNIQAENFKLQENVEKISVIFYANE